MVSASLSKLVHSAARNDAELPLTARPDARPGGTRPPANIIIQLRINLSVKTKNI